MASRRSVFMGAFGWDDWVWWITIGCVVLLILLLLVCCCVCMQRAKRKGYEEALASVQARQRLTQEHERAEQQHQARDTTFANNNGSINGSTNGYQPAYGYSEQFTAALQPNRKNLGPQVAANGYQKYPSQLHTQQFAKSYPSLPGQKTGKKTGPRKWYNADRAQSRSPSSRGNDANAPSSFGFDAHTSSQYPDSMRFDDPYPTGAGTDGVPFMSISSPSASKSSNANQKNGARLQKKAAYNRETEKQIPAPVAPPRPSPAGAGAGLESGASGSTLQSRIDALRSTDTNNMVHSRISVGPTDLLHPSAKTGGALGTFGMSEMSNAQDSYASKPAGRSGLSAGNILSLNSSTLSNSLFPSPSSSLSSGHSYETLHPEACESAKSTVLGDALTHGSSRSIGSDYSHGQFGDTGSFGPDGRGFKEQNSNNGYSPTLSRPTREDCVSFNSCNSVEF